MTAAFDLQLRIILAVLALAMVLGFARIVRGPSLADRVVALDLIATAGVAQMAVAAIAFDLDVFLDVGILLALIGFVGTAAFARYIEQRGRPWR